MKFWISSAWVFLLSLTAHGMDQGLSSKELGSLVSNENVIYSREGTGTCVSAEKVRALENVERFFSETQTPIEKAFMRERLIEILSNEEVSN